MAYQRFRARKVEWTPATLATVATLQGEIAETVANVATVAKGVGRNSAPTPPAASIPATVDAADLAMEAEERAAILQYDAGLPREEAERQAFGRKSRPGITIRAPAVELPAVEYDRHLEGLIAAAGEGTPETSLLAYAKLKGWVVQRGDETVFTRGR